jgi:hypothetical protein
MKKFVKVLNMFLSNMFKFIQKYIKISFLQVDKNGPELVLILIYAKNIELKILTLKIKKEVQFVSNYLSSFLKKYDEKKLTICFH